MKAPKRRQPFVPFALRNHTGCTLWHTHDLRIHQLQVRVNGWEAVNPVSVDKVGIFFRYAAPDKSNSSSTVGSPISRTNIIHPQVYFSSLPPVRVVFAVTMEGSARKVITVRSALIVKNKLEMPMELRLDSPSAPDKPVLLPAVMPGDSFAIPLHLTSWRLQARPKGTGVFFCKSPIHWTNVQKTSEVSSSKRECHSMELDHSRFFRIISFKNLILPFRRISLENFTHCKELLIPPGTQNYVVRMRLYDNNRRLLNLTIRIVCQAKGSLKIFISAPYWLINKTENAKTDAAGQFEEHELARSLSPLLFCYADKEQPNLCTMRVGRGIHPEGMPGWCQAFSLDGGSGVRALKVIQQGNRPGLIYNIGRGTSNPEGYISTLPGSSVVFHWPRNDYDQLLCVRLMDVPNCIWSGGFEVNKNNSFHINMSTEVKPSTTLDYAWDEPTLPPYITLTVKGAGSSEVTCYMNDFQESKQLYYENFIYIAATYTFSGVQEETGRPVATSKDLDCAELVLDVSPKTQRVILKKKEPGKRSQLWRMTGTGMLCHEGSAVPRHPNKPSPPPSAESSMILDIAGLAAVTDNRWAKLTAKGGRAGLRDGAEVVLGPDTSLEQLSPVPSEQQFINQKMRPGSGALAVQVIPDGPTRVLQITDFNQRRNDRLSYEGEELDQDLWKLKNPDLEQELEVQLKLEGGIGLSLVNKAPEELIFASFMGITVHFTQLSASQVLELSIQDVQVENYDETLHEKPAGQELARKRYYFENLKISIPQIKLSVFTSSKLPLDLKALKSTLGFPLVRFEDAVIDLDPYTRVHPYETKSFIINDILKHFQE
ncbi:Vacuolar protein sorting-associated protein 13D, partial [Ophiophagus hannah]